MQYEKITEIVHETEEAYIATIWTGPNCYIGWFPKADLDAYVKYAEECGHYVSLEETIRRTSVGDMHFMCKTEDYDQDTLDMWIAYLLNPDAPASEVQKEVT